MADDSTRPAEAWNVEQYEAAMARLEELQDQVRVPPYHKPKTPRTSTTNTPNPS